MGFKFKNNGKREGGMIQLVSKLPPDQRSENPILCTVGGGGGGEGLTANKKKKMQLQGCSFFQSFISPTGIPCFLNAKKKKNIYHVGSNSWLADCCRVSLFFYPPCHT